MVLLKPMGGLKKIPIVDSRWGWVILFECIKGRVFE